MASPNTLKLKTGPRMVSVLHKQLDPAKDGESGLAVGRVFTFPKSKDAYQVQPSGALINVNGKPYGSKADRKALKRARRDDRLEVKKNLALVGKI